MVVNEYSLTRTSMIPPVLLKFYLNYVPEFIINFYLRIKSVLSSIVFICIDNISIHEYPASLFHTGDGTKYIRKKQQFGQEE